MCNKRRFSNNEKSKYLLDKNIDPRLISRSSDRKYFFKCHCTYIFESQISSITNRKHWCPHCCVPTQKLCDNYECKVCDTKRFSNHEKSKYILDKNIDSRLIPKMSCKKFFFQCSCTYIFESVISGITRGSWCPHCCINQKQLCGNYECKLCDTKRFLNHEKSKFLITKDVNTRMIFISSMYEYEFKCDNIECNRIFIKSPNNITNGKQWCPHHRNKTETKVYDFLNQNYIVEREKTFEWLDRKRYDFYLPDFKLIIEVDGRQHYEHVEFFNKYRSLEDIQRIDKLKELKAFENDLHVLRLNQEDVLNDKIDWKEIIKTKLLLLSEPFDCLQIAAI